MDELASKKKTTTTMTSSSDNEIISDNNNHHNHNYDTYRIAYLIHFLLGAGNLLPWNALITAVDYFAYLYPTKHIEKVFSVAYMTSSVLVLVVVMTWQSHKARMMRMNIGFSLFVISLMVPSVIDWATTTTRYDVVLVVGGSNNNNKPSRHRPSCAYGFTVAAVVVCGLADGLVAGSLIGSAGKLPRQYMQAVFAGTASSGHSYCVGHLFCIII